jgi:hypothetical protein
MKKTISSKAPKTITEFKLWKDNKIAGEWTITVEKAVEAFKESEYWQYHLNGWPIERAFAAFVTDKEEEGGLQSSWELTDRDKILDAVYRFIYPPKK